MPMTLTMQLNANDCDWIDSSMLVFSFMYMYMHYYLINK